jgi:hypothetical protein
LDPKAAPNFEIDEDEQTPQLNADLNSPGQFGDEKD